MRGLREAAASRWASEQENAKSALRFPWAWPIAAEPALEALASRPADPAPGKVVLVSIAPRLRRADVWAFGFHEQISAGGPALSGNLIRLLERLEHLVLQPLEGWAARRDRLRGAPGAELIGGIGDPGHLDVLDGESFGAALALAAASRALGRAVPIDIAVLAGVDADGRLTQIDGLDLKLEALLAWAPAITRVAVCEEDLLTARAFVGAKLKVEPYALLTQLVDRLLPLSDLAIHDSSADAANALFKVAVYSRASVHSWRAVADATQVLLQRGDLDAGAKWKLECARAIARRHNAQPEPLPGPPPSTVALNRKLREALQAHRIQGLLDAGADALPSEVASTLAALPAIDECSLEQLMIRGALGRALARLRRYSEAATLLRETVDGWSERDQLCDARFALGELARVEGIRGARLALLRVNDDADQLRRESRLDRISEGHLRQAMGRAWVQGGDPGRALEWLRSDFDWTLVDPWLRCAKLRWEALALRGEQAARVRAEVIAARNAAADQALLAAIDEALERGESSSALVREYLATDAGKEVRWLLEKVPPDEQGKVLTNEAPY